MRYIWYTTPMNQADVVSERLPTGLVVSSIARSLEFYCGLLGYRLAGDLPLPGEQECWDDYYARLCGIEGARIRCAYLAAPDGDMHIELIEHDAPIVPAPARRAFHEPGTAMLVLKVEGSEALVERMRRAGVDIVSANPVSYLATDGVSSLTTYLYDPDGIPFCLFEGLHQLGLGESSPAAATHNGGS
jgi:catechol 2,3-dioxygenase-like lactoylglutathione lyase family enzyme